MIRIGTGFDVHAFAPDRRLWLCGVNIPHSLGLAGHSDADVAIHALCDALLGAAALGDMGHHFPDTDQQYKGIDSRRLLRHVVQLLSANDYTINNIDITIIAQQPKLAPHIPQMRLNMAADLCIGIDCVSVKATTTEHLGFTGRSEGIAAQAAVLIQNRV